MYISYLLILSESLVCHCDICSLDISDGYFSCVIKFNFDIILFYLKPK